LENSVSFNGKWKIKFKKTNEKRSFFGEKSQITVRFIESYGKYFYVNNEDMSYKLIGLDFEEKVLILKYPYSTP
jgi:serine protease inhibitor